MNTISLILGVLSALGLLLGFLPLFGWLNWIVVLPPALLGLVLGLMAPRTGPRSGVTLNVVVIVLAALRLFLGGGLL